MLEFMNTPSCNHYYLVHRIKVKNVIAYSEAKDLALLELEEAPGYPPLPIGESRVKKGDKVSTIGSPLGLINTVSGCDPLCGQL